MSRPGRDGAGASVFEVKLRHGVWQVIRDGAFYGHYRARKPALEAAMAAARLPPTRLKPAEVVVHAEDA